jgi:hypothetical protein
MDRSKIAQDPCHLGVLLGASKMISEPMVRSQQTVHLSCVKVTTLSKRTESSFHLSLVTMKYHWVRPKWFLSLWYVYRKLCTCLAPTLTLSPNGPKWDSKWPKLHRSYIRSIQNNFLSLWFARRKACTYLASRLALFPNGLNRASTWASSPRSITGCIQNNFWAYGTFAANHAPILLRH